MEAVLHHGGDAHGVRQRIITLCDVGVDVLLLLARHLDVCSLARLEQTCKTMQSFVLQHGWSLLVAKRARSADLTATMTVLHPTSNRSAKETIKIDHAWATRTFVASQCSLDTSVVRHGDAIAVGLQAGNPQKQTHVSVPFCQLHLLPHGLLLLMRSQLRYWSAEQLKEHAPIAMDLATTVRLENPANLDVQWRARQQQRTKRRGSDPEGHRITPEASAHWDICASAALDRRGELIALGRANGLIEVVSLQRTATRQEELKVNLRWIWRDLMDGSTTIQTMTACSHHSGLLVVCSKHGDVWLMTIRSRANNARRRAGVTSLNARSIQHWRVPGRIWSACFGGRQSSTDGSTRTTAAWLAIGTSGASGSILLFRLCASTLQPTYVTSLRCGGVSVYALKATSTTANEDVLYAGCYDGKVRIFQIGRILLQQTADICDDVHVKAALMEPARVLYDRFDPNAIYSLCLGVGQGGQHVAAGTSRHGIVKIFRPSGIARAAADDNDGDEEEEEEEGEGWSIFAGHPSRSPTYALAGQHDRLFGVTDEKLWQIDLRPPPRTDASYQARTGKERSEKRRKDRTLAYYEHRDMVLATSVDPVKASSD